MRPTPAPRRHPVVLLCVRCMAAAEIADLSFGGVPYSTARGWAHVLTNGRALDVCPVCAPHILDYLRETPPRPEATP